MSCGLLVFGKCYHATTMIISGSIQSGHGQYIRVPLTGDVWFTSVTWLRFEHSRKVGLKIGGGTKLVKAQILTNAAQLCGVAVERTIWTVWAECLVADPMV